MATKTPVAETDPYAPYTFPITCVIGEVTVDPLADSGVPAHVAAMDIIARHDTEGRFTFPMKNGDTCSVTVEFIPADQIHG